GETQAFAINDGGKVAGYTNGNAVIWQNGSITKNLGQFNRGTPVPTGINDDGRVVGWGLGTGIQRRAWIWTGSGKIQDLNSLLPRNAGWTLEKATGIDAGGLIFGQGSTSGAEHGFLMTPTSVPAAAATTPAANLTNARTSGLAPVEAAVQSPLPRAAAPP